MDKKIKKTQKGFSFLELILAIFIIAFPLLTFIGVIAKSMDHSTESRNTIVAAGLAQEGVELIKNVRDNNWAQGMEAFQNLGSNSNCRINYNYDMDDPCSGGNSLNLYWTEGGFYSHDDSSGELTRFSRKIEISVDEDTRIVTSYVAWEGASFPDDSTDCYVANKCVFATITLTKWGEE